MSKHSYKIESKSAVTVKDFTTKGGLLPTPQQMALVTFKAKCDCGCGKQLYGNKYAPETNFLNKPFSHFTNPKVVNGKSDGYRAVTTSRAAGGKQVAVKPRNWDKLFYLCFVNADLKLYSELPEDFKEVLEQKAPNFEECWKKYNGAKDTQLTYDHDDMLFNRAKCFLDLLPKQPTPGQCKPHKRKADAVEQPAMIHANADVAVMQPAVVAIEEPAVMNVNADAAVMQPAVVPINIQASVAFFDNIMQAGFNIGVASVMSQASVQASAIARGIPYSAVVQPAVVPVNMQASVAFFDDILQMGIDVGVAYGNTQVSVHAAVPRVEPPVPLLKPVVPRVKPPVPLFKPAAVALVEPAAVALVEPAAVMTEFNAFFGLGPE